MLGKDLVIIAKNSLTTKSLFNEMTTQGIKFTPGNVVSAGKDNGGKIIFLEKEIQKKDYNILWNRIGANLLK